MKLLIIGGKRFLGRYIVESALAQGHELTLFNRGKSNPDLFPEIEQVHGDRDSDVGLLRGRHWDAVIDTCGYFPRQVRTAAEELASSVERYIFISTISVFADFSQPGMDENAPLATLADESIEEITNESYGGLKALCEQAAEQAMPGRTLIVRPGLIVGPHDATDRFTYWPYRIARGGNVLAPGEPEQPVQFVDVRDLASWVVRMAEARKTGIYNATGPNYMLAMDAFLEKCRQVTGSDARFVWVSNQFLTEHEIYLPLWAPLEEAGAWAIDCRKAIDEGLTFRPLEQTISDTLAWKGNDTPVDDLRAGLKTEQEKELLQKWGQ